MSIYFLHIPRTSGIYIANNVIPKLVVNKVEHFASNRSIVDPEKIAKSEYVSGHFGLTPIELMDNPIVYSIFRDPVERFISYFNYTTGIIRSRSEAYKKFDSWINGEQAEIQSNQQTKFITGYMNFNKFNKGVNEYQRAVNNGWFIENYSLDVEDAKANIDIFNCYTLDNHESFKKDFNEDLKKHFSFTTFKNKDKANTSSNLGIEFTKSQIKKIEDLNSVDMEVYEYVQKTQKRY